MPPYLVYSPAFINSALQLYEHTFKKIIRCDSNLQAKFKKTNKQKKTLHKNRKVSLAAKAKLKYTYGILKNYKIVIQKNFSG